METPAEPCLELLLADDDLPLRELTATWARDVIPGIVILEATDGAEAVELGLQRQPQLALLDVVMPRLDGIAVAAVLRASLPNLRLALYSANAAEHRDRASGLGLPIFDKLEPAQATRWLSAQAEAETRPQRKLDAVCATCGYGIVRRSLPRRCPMCRRESGWQYRRARRVAHVM